MTKRRGFPGTPEEYFTIVKDIFEIIGDVNQGHSMLDDERDIEGIVETLKILDYHHDSKDSRYRSYLPITEIVQQVVWMKDKNATTLPKENLLEKEKIGSKNQAGKEITNYDHMLARYIADKGEPIHPIPSYYSWSDFEMYRHIKGPCSIAAVTSVKEDYWSEFNGTFNEDDNTVHGLNAHAQCKCGYFKGELRYQGRVTEIIKEMANNYL